jgi:hypothetical protein
MGGQFLQFHFLLWLSKQVFVMVGSLEAFKIWLHGWLFCRVLGKLSALFIKRDYLVVVVTKLLYNTLARGIYLVVDIGSRLGKVSLPTDDAKTEQLMPRIRRSRV